MGDSSFDNKYWFTDTAPACNGYERALAPSSKTKKLSSKSADGGVTSKQDMAYWFNKALVATGNGANNVCVNAAVEESTLSNRFNGPSSPSTCPS
jgi:hypothetical protein